MIHVVGIVINSRYLIEGLVLEGKPSEFGEISDKSKIRKTVSRASLLANSFSNSEVVCKDNKIIRKDGFKFSDCELYTVKDTKIHKIKDNTISILRRIVQNNETIGFEVKLLGNTSKLSTSNVIALSTIFKPVGYTVAARHGEEARIDPKTKKLITVEVRKPYLTGIGGNKLSDLPVLVIDKIDKGKSKSESAKGTEEHKPSTKTIQNEDIKTLEPNPSAVGLLELLDLIDKLDGLIVTNDKTTYTRQTVDREDKEKSAFVPLEMVQVAEPIISTSDKTVNVNLKFKKLGFVYVDGTPVPSFMWREKSIFSNGNPNLDKFSVALTKESVITLFKIFGESLALEVNDTNKKILGSIKALGLRSNAECLINIDASKLSITNKKINELEGFKKGLVKLHCSKLALKILKGISISNDTILPAYSNYSKEMLEKIKELGVNTSTGSYTSPMLEVDNSEESSDKQGDKQGDKQEKVSNIEVEYFLAGYRTLPKVSDLLVKKDKFSLAQEKALSDFNNDIELIEKDIESNDNSYFLAGLPEKTVNYIRTFGVGQFLALHYIDFNTLDTDSKNKLIDFILNSIRVFSYKVDNNRKDLVTLKLSILTQNDFKSYGDGSDWEIKKARANQKADIYEWKKNEAVNLSLRNISFNN